MICPLTEKSCDPACAWYVKENAQCAMFLVVKALEPRIEIRTAIGEVNAEVVRAIRNEIADQEAEELERREIAVREAACGDTDKD